jgi:ankyrin repeat protein
MSEPPSEVSTSTFDVKTVADLLGPEFLARHFLESCRLGLTDRVRHALEERIDVNVQDDEGMTGLHHAAAHGARPCIRLLVNSGKCDYLIKDKYGRYASELAIEWGRDYAVARLLTKKQVQQAHRQGVPAFDKPDIKD